MLLFSCKMVAERNTKISLPVHVMKSLSVLTFFVWSCGISVSQYIYRHSLFLQNVESQKYALCDTKHTNTLHTTAGVRYYILLQDVSASQSPSLSADEPTGDAPNVDQLPSRSLTVPFSAVSDMAESPEVKIQASSVSFSIFVTKIIKTHRRLNIKWLTLYY